MQEILNIKHRIRRKSKKKFLSLIEKELNKYGYESKFHTFRGFVKSVNLEAGDDHPQYIFVAHYDTLTIMPFWIGWLMKLAGINRQLLQIIIVMVLAFLNNLLRDVSPLTAEIITWILYGSMLSFLIPTPVNYDDNTSGVITLLKLAKQCKEKGIDRVKFLFVDNEELGLFGSAAQATYWSARGKIPDGCRIISIDCVGGKGKIPLLIRNSNSPYSQEIKDALKDSFGACKSVRMVLPASDNFSFRFYGAVNISFVDRSLIPGGYTISNIHSPFDSKLDLQRLDRLAETLVQVMQKSKNIDNPEEILQVV